MELFTPSCRLGSLALNSTAQPTQPRSCEATGGPQRSRSSLLPSRMSLPMLWGGDGGSGRTSSRLLCPSLGVLELGSRELLRSQDLASERVRDAEQRVVSPQSMHSYSSPSLSFRALQVGHCQSLHVD